MRKNEIDGLRAIAVLCIVFFHFDFKYFQGGFLGVDIFFVISGYLITQLINKEYSVNETFSYSNFYLRRAKRLLPSFLFTLIFAFIVGYNVLSLEHFKRFTGALLHSLISISNFFFMNENGYFDTSSIYKPLLHTWSLGVEEQFYFIWPLLLVFFLRFKKILKPIYFLIGLFLISIGLNIIYKENHSVLFFMTPFRVFEFSLGSMLVCVPQHFLIKKNIYKEIITLLGLLLIAVPVLSYDENNLSSLFYGLTASFGTVLIVYSGKTNYLGKILNNRVAVNIGLSSYSLYLIHWPLLVFYKYYVMEPLSIEVKLILIISAIVLAKLQYQYIETPWRYKTDKNKQFIFITIFTIIIMAIISFISWKGVLIKNKSPLIPNHKIVIDNEQLTESRSKTCYLVNFDKRISHPSCNTLNEKNLNILTLGDSHEMHTNMIFSELFKDSPVNVVSALTLRKNTHCLFNKKGYPKDGNHKECSGLMNKLNDFDFISKTFKVIVFGSDQASEMYDILVYLSRLQKAHPEIRIIILGNLLRLNPYKCVTLINKFNNFSACNNQKIISYFNPNQVVDIKKRNPELQFTYIDLISLFCKDRKAVSCEIVIDNYPIFRDGNHFNMHGVNQIIKKIKKNESLYQDLRNIILHSN